MTTKADHILDAFAHSEDWFDKYEILIKMGSELSVMDEKDKTDDNAISGCQSRLWIKARLKDGKIYFSGDSDAKITRGILAVVLYVADQQPPKKIVDIDWGFLDRIGLSTHLSPARANGLTSILKRIRQLALENIDQALE
ncbi:MAG: SufE family protein [Candidatus Marinimicrobia bacterium]|nr:SufE family protein [Candidatus Neomarinimicrobiota bacterium]